jgi:hypothetical protein
MTNKKDIEQNTKKKRWRKRRRRG